MTEPISIAPAPAGEGRRNPLFRLLQIAAVGTVAALLALLVWRLVASGRGAELVRAIRDSRKPAAPVFVLPVIWRNAETWPPSLRSALSARTLSLGVLRDRPVVLNFWASWCGPCKDEAPRLAASARAHSGQVVFLGVDVQDLSSAARRFLRHYDVRYGSVRDNGGVTYDDYGLTGVPETYWVDARGRIVAHYAGEVSRAQLEDGIRLVEASR